MWYDLILIAFAFWRQQVLRAIVDLKKRSVKLFTIFHIVNSLNAKGTVWLLNDGNFGV